QALGAAGYRLVISGRRKEELDKAAAVLDKAGCQAQVRQLDVSDAAAVQATADAIYAEHGHSDALVLSAGTNIPNRAWKGVRPEGERRNWPGRQPCWTRRAAGRRCANSTCRMRRRCRRRPMRYTPSTATSTRWCSQRAPTFRTAPGRTSRRKPLPR